MAKFKNVVTGNVLEVTDPLTIALMTKSDRYESEDEAEEPVAKKTAKAKSEG